MKKRNFAMNKIKAIAFGAIIFALLACEQPFKAGLGPVVDIRDPTLTLIYPSAGSFIWGNMTFSGTAEDDYILSKVEIKVTNRPEATFNKVPYLQVYTPVNLVKSRQNEGVWSFTLHTVEKVGDDIRKVFPEGDLKLRLKVTDSVGKSTETDEIVFQVKNTPPAISVTAPNIKRGDGIGEIGGSHLNYYSDSISPTTLPSSISYPRRVDKKTYLTGSITDNQGIYTGPVTANKYPPQYRLWQVVASEDADRSTTFAPGYLPTEEEVGWTAFDQQKQELFPLTGVGNYMFGYELPDAPGNFYGLEIRACSIDNDSTKFHYPRDYYDNDYFDNPGSAPTEWAKIENRYALIYIKAPEATPTVGFYNLEDIFGEVSGNSFTTLPVDRNESHPYVNDDKVSKNGPFTLRVKAMHQEGILRAEVYWQKEGSPLRGRFIWDLADEAPLGSSNWNPSNTVSATQAYSMWGYVDQISDKTRNFVFTYNHDGKDRIPEGTGYNSLVQGRSKIQRYTATGDDADTAWRNKHTAQFAWSTLDGPWEDMAKLEEGVYNIEVYATSASNTGMIMPATRTVLLDWVAPELEINKIDGEYGPANAAPFLPTNGIADPNASVVNGVIELELLISDSRPVDSQIRNNRDAYFGGAKEQVFIVIRESDYTAMEAEIKTKENWWPTLTVEDYVPTATITGVTVERHGVIQGNKFRLKTTKIYSTAETGDVAPLGDGDYRLYLFARDNAFNVKSIAKKLVVRAASDKPRFDFNVGTTPIQLVTMPDFAGQTGSGGFFYGGSVRNLLGANQEIKINIKDDDSLNLGIPATGALNESGIKIEFSTSYQNSSGGIIEKPLPDLIDTTVKEIFGTQSVVGTNRVAAKDRTGTIEQKHFPLAVSNGGRLPDGVYKLKITVPDYPPLKLRLNSETSDPLVESVFQEFWFAVNDNPPVFNQTLTPSAETATLELLRDTGVKGVVTAANGPITMSYALTRGQESIDSRALLATEIPVTNAKLADGIWEVNFTAKLNLGTTPSGTYTLRLTATDRFGKSSVLPYQFTIDNDGPIVTRRVAMQTVDRSSFYNTPLLASNDLTGISEANMKVLANEVVSVTLRAFDISGVKELRYWLHQSGTPLVVPSVSGGVWADPASLPADSRYGSLAGADKDYGDVEFRINLAGLTSGSYDLYALALDNKDNITESKASLQTIFVDQRSDYPFFSDFGLAGKAVGGGGAVISGTIYDDDGFQTATGSALRANSIRVWMSTTGTAGTSATGDTTIDGGPTDTIPTGYTRVDIPVANLTSMGSGKNIGVNINLQDHFPTLFSNAQGSIDGRKHVIIQATDSPATKLNATIGGPAVSDRKYRRQYFNFMYDNKPPEISISSPTQGASFGGEIGSSTFNFSLVGYIQDANLAKDTNGDFYFKYRLNDDVNTYNFTLGQAVGGFITGITTPVTGETRVAFRINDSASIKELLYQTAVPGRPVSESSKLQEGNNTLVLLAWDESGKEARYSLKFFIDIKGPNTFLTLKEVKLEDITKPAGFNDWWTPPAGTPAAIQAWYQTRRTLLDDKDVPVIQRLANNADFYITGTFVDDASNVTRIFNYWFDNGATMGTSANADLTYIPNPPGTASLNARWQVNIKSLSDGLHTIRLRPADQYGNTEDSKNFAFRINSSKPEVDFTPATKAQHNVFGRRTGQLETVPMFTISGTANSPNLENVNLIVRHTGGYTPVSIDLVPARAATTNTGIITNAWTFTSTGTPATITENLAWSVEITRGNINKAGNDDTLREGTYEIAVVSSDMYGGESSEAIWTFTIDKSPPQISYNRLTALYASNIAVTPYTLVNTPQQSKTLTGNTVISSRIQDKDSLSDISAVQLQIRKYTYATATTNASWAFYNYTANAWTGTNATYYTVTVPSESKRDFMLDLDLKNILGDSLVDGFYSISMRAKDSSTMVGGDNGYTANGANGGSSNGNPFTSDTLYFFYANNTPDVEHINNEQTTFSSRDGPVSLGITAMDANRFHTLDVSVESVASGTVLSNLTQQVLAQSTPNNWITTEPWTRMVNISFKDGADKDYPEGRYRVYFKVTDLAGRSTTINRVIYLDNNPPSGSIDEPRHVGLIYSATNGNNTPSANILYHYAGELRNGGEPLTISGTADDVSGLREIWFHLGYGTKTSFPTPEDAAEFWGNNPAAPQANSAWFKYERKANVTGEVTDGPPATTNDPQFPFINFDGMNKDYLFKWSFTMTREAIEYYARAAVRINNKDYNNYNATTPDTPHATGPWMVRPIPDNDTIPNSFRKSGLYSLPLYVRIVDSAGNVNYIQRDIWIYPNGDYPSTTIINPSIDSERGSPRGGQVNFEGMASDNVSVRRVIYRVRADRKLNAADLPDEDESGVILPAEKEIGQTPLDTYNDYARINEIYLKVKGLTDIPANRLAGKGWYVANLESQDYGQSVPWNFTLNANGEFDSIIASKGFNAQYPTADQGTYVNDTVRLWVEIYVFDDTEPRKEEFNLMSLGAGSKDDPKSYVRVLYLKSTAPKIENRYLSNKGSTTNFGVYDQNNATRRGQFAIQASLNGNGSAINQISVRLQQDTGTGLSSWRDARVGLVSQNLPGITITQDEASAVRNSLNQIIGYERYTITYRFDTALTVTGTNFQQVMGGAWSANGGRYTIDVRIRDSGSPPGQDMYTFVVGVDNYAPFASAREITNTKVAGTNVAFMGRVFDYQNSPTNPTPPYRGIQEVRVWFTQLRDTPNASSVLIDPNGGTNTAPLGDNTVTAWNGRTATINYDGTGTTIASIPTVTTGTLTTVRYPTNTDYVKVLNETTAAVMDNRITWQSTLNHDIYWSFVANTIQMPDGWITMHYLVEDTAGNVSYYTQYMVVMNKYPQITDIVLFTNNTGTGAVFTTHEGDQAYSQYRVEKGYGTDPNRGDGTYLNSGFISKNSVIGFGVKTLTGTRNFPLHYQAQYVQRVKIPLTSENLEQMADSRGSLATLNGTPGFINLYTIVDDTHLGTNTWITLGVKEAIPAIGNHFVFQPTKAEVAGMHEPNAYVYAYRQVFTPKAQVDRTAAQLNQPLQLGDETIYLDVLPSDGPAPMLGLNYSGGTYFNPDVVGNPSRTDRINEFKGSQPGLENGSAVNGTVNNPDSTAFFIIKVWDSVTPSGANSLASHEMLYDAVVIGMNVYLTDTERPVARIYDLNPYTETAVSGNNINSDWRDTTQNNAANPRGIGQNILRGGLHNVKTERDMVKSGHIEPRHNTTALNAWYEDRNSGWTQFPPNGFVIGDSAQLTAADTMDRVSGKIILRGLVYDNQLINSISIQFDNAAAIPMLRLLPVKVDPSVTGDDVLYTWPVTTVPTGYSKKIVPALATTTGVYLVEELHWKTGHTVEWAYVWNTDTYSPGPSAATGVRIRVSATDNIGGLISNEVTVGQEVLPPNATTTPPNPVKFHNDINVLIVPYVVGFERDSTKFATTRSLQGWYSFYQNEAGISLLGYNLGGTTAPSMRIRTSSTTTTAITGVSSIANGEYPFTRRYIFTIPDDAVSGKIEVAPNANWGTGQIYNHDSTHGVGKSWNNESSANQSGSGLWINKPYAHIWRTQQSTDTPTPYTYFGGNQTTESANLSSPSMALAYANENTTTSGSLHGAWSIYGTATIFYGANNNGARTRLSYNALPTEPYVDPDISLFEGMYNGPTTVYNANVALVYQSDGTPSVQLKTRMDALTNAATGDPTRISDQTDQPTQRWRNSRIAKAAVNNDAAAHNVGRAYVTSYDSRYGNLWLASLYGIVTTTANNTRYVVDGTNSNITTNGYTTAPITTNKTGALTAVVTAGEYSAVDYDQWGPVVAYYDQDHDTVRIAYGTIAAATSAITNWGRQYVIPTTHALHKGSGKYVSIKVDRTNRVHLAFYNSNLQTVVYASAPSREGVATTNVFTFDTIHTVDNVVQGGTWTDISVDNYGNPWITYAVTSRTENYDGVRIAYKSAANAEIRTGAIAFTRPASPAVGTGTNPSIQGWEAVTMPANFTVNNDRLNIEAWPPSNRHNGGTAAAPAGTLGGVPGWNAAVGYGSPNAFRIGYFYVPTFKEDNTY
jgi:hypothetical protein